MECHAQQQGLKYFTVSDGLPSNHIYKCLQDKRGFLWIASENGLSRFDGQQFKNYTVSDGLPDNEILDIFLDSAERLWLIPFNKSPAFFDTKSGKIINAEILPELGKIESKKGLLGNVLDAKRLAFYEYRKKVSVFEDNKIKYSFKTPDDFNVMYVKKSRHGEIILSNKGGYLIQNGKRINSFPSFYKKQDEYLSVNKVIERDGILFIARGDSVIMQIKNLDENLLPTILTKRFHFRTWNISLLSNCIGAIGRNGIIYFLNPDNLEIIKEIDVGENIKDITEDTDGNYWVCTDNRGLIKISKPKISSVSSALLNVSISALNIDSLRLLTGNNSGDLVEYTNNHFKAYSLIPDRDRYNNIIVKKILKYRNKDCIVSFSGLYLGSKGVYKKCTNTKGFKDADFINDSMLLLGSYNYLYKYNMQSGKMDTLAKKRITSVAVNKNGICYYGSNDGLYKLTDTGSVYFGEKNSILSNNITTLLCTSDNLIWIGMASDTLVVLQNESIILKFPIKNNFQGSICKSLNSIRRGQVWVGTEKSLGRIDYSLIKEGIEYTCSFFNKADGLSGGQVNDISFYKDTVYIATTTGVSKLGINAKPIIKDIPVYITRLWVNSRSVDVQESYELSSSENNIQIEFAGVDLTEFNPQFQYKIDKSEWQNILDNTLFLSRLAHGTYYIQIRALKRNNEPSGLIATLTIKIKTPFFLSPLFWVLLAVLSTGLFFWLYNRGKLAKQKSIFQQQTILEQQRNKITADLHDNIGASLSSLQVNSSIANQLINKDIKQAKLVLKKIENQAKNLADTIGDIIWSMKPGKDEFMTMSSRIKNFANDILSATEIEYEIQIDKQIDSLIKDITVRKNIVFITKEAINNAVKYSRASRLLIRLQLEKQQLILSITDNGIGFNAQEASGNGIVNMQKRAEEINGSFQLKTAPAKGTAISFIIPIP